MIPLFDVFSITNKGTLWVKAAESLAQAFEIAREKGTGSYLIFSQQTGHKMMYEVDATGTIRPVYVK